MVSNTRFPSILVAIDDEIQNTYYCIGGFLVGALRGGIIAVVQHQIHKYSLSLG